MVNTKVFKRKSFLEKLQAMADKDEIIGAIVECKNPKKFAEELKEKHPQINIKYVYNIIDAIAVETTAKDILENLSVMNDVEVIDEDM
ncbi:MAG: hypothetical protein ACTSWR_09940, partial [Candidatus Helarchaeota archaeon]